MIKIDSNYFRPAEVETLLGDASKAKKILNWEPEISLEELIEEMIENDKNIALKDKILEKEFSKINKN